MLSAANFCRSVTCPSSFTRSETPSSLAAPRDVFAVRPVAHDDEVHVVPVRAGEYRNELRRRFARDQTTHGRHHQSVLGNAERRAMCARAR